MNVEQKVNAIMRYIVAESDEEKKNAMEKIKRIIEPVATENPDVLCSITNKLYPAVAEQHGTTASRCERSIRHAIECTWDRGSIDVFEKYFGNTISITKGKPTNSEFIARMANIVKRKML